MMSTTSRVALHILICLLIAGIIVFRSVSTTDVLPVVRCTNHTASHKRLHGHHHNMQRITHAHSRTFRAHKPASDTHTHKHHSYSIDTVTICANQPSYIRTSLTRLRTGVAAIIFSTCDHG